MSKITLKYEFEGKGNFLKIQVEEQDIKTQHQIKENNREVFELKEKDDLSYKEIAKRKGITRQADQKHYHTAIKKLCDFYEKRVSNKNKG